jgi:hypothetical protein
MEADDPPTTGRNGCRQQFAQHLSCHQCLTFTVRGVNDAGEGPASTGDTIVIS